MGSSVTGFPIFIIGSYRSGTSVTSWCLGQHYNIWVLPETYWLAQFAQSLDGLYAAGSSHDAAHFTRCGLPAADFYEEAADFVLRVVRRGQERRIRKMLTFFQNSTAKPVQTPIQRAPLEPKRRWVDGTPENAHYVEALLRLFPGARFIHLVRSPHEVVRSLGKFDQAGGVAQGVQEAYGNWRRLAEAAFDAEKQFGSHVVRRFFYEDLVNDSEATLRSMLNFVGERFRPECLDPLEKRMNSSQVDGDPVFTAETVPSVFQSEFRANEVFFEELQSTGMISMSEPKK